MGEKFLIDTNILIDFQNGIIPSKELVQIKKIIDENFIISFITYIEFLGYSNASESLEEFVSLANVIEINKRIIDQTILIRKAYRIKLPYAIIAATAMIYDFTLISRNTKDFEGIQGLKLLNPYIIVS